jgi:hypothetical protein
MDGGGEASTPDELVGERVRVDPNRRHRELTSIHPWLWTSARHAASTVAWPPFPYPVPAVASLRRWQWVPLHPRRRQPAADQEQLQVRTDKCSNDPKAQLTQLLPSHASSKTSGATTNCKMLAENHETFVNPRALTPKTGSVETSDNHEQCSAPSV